MSEKIAFYPTPSTIAEYMHVLSGAETDSRILEAGFGDGAFLNVFKNNTNVTGVEYDIKFADEAKEKFPNYNIYQQDYLSFNRPNSFDNVTGNPPYINADNLDIGIRENIKDLTHSGEGNIYYAFIIHSINNLVDGGVLTYILPYDFFYNTYANYLRGFMIDNGFFTDIIDLGESRVFKGAAPETIIFRYVKGQNTTDCKINVKQTKCLSLEVVEENLLNGFKDFDCYEQPQFNKEQNIWFLSDVEHITGTKLKDIDGLKISVGIVNGAEPTFVIDTEIDEYKALTPQDKTTYIRTFIKNKNRPTDVNDYTKDGEDYIFIDTNSFADEKDFENRAPNIFNYLKRDKEEMLKRKLSKNKSWFDYLAIRNMTVFNDNKNKLKIHVPSLTRLEKDWFFKSKNDFFVGGDLVTITLSGDEEKLEKIFNYLNSDEFVVYYRATGAKKGKRTVFTQNIISNIVIPEHIVYTNVSTEALF